MMGPSLRIVQCQEALQRLLGLSDSQIAEILQKKPKRMAIDLETRNETADRFRRLVLNEQQIAKVVAVEKVLDNRDAAAVWIGLGLMRETRWPGNALCVNYPAATYASYPFASSELALTPSQAQRFEQLRQQRDKAAEDLRRQVLTEEQKKRLAAFEADVQIASEAIELGLIATPTKGEILCH